MQAPALVTIFFGANDAVLATGNYTDYHVPVDEYKQHLLQMVKHVRVSASLLLVTQSAHYCRRVAWHLLPW